jgi:hypothetical protein
VWLVAPTLATVIGKDQSELSREGPTERRDLRVLQRIGETGVNQDRIPLSAQILERGAETVNGIDGVVDVQPSTDHVMSGGRTVAHRGQPWASVKPRRPTNLRPGCIASSKSDRSIS